jgi:hypothetical protein
MLLISVSLSITKFLPEQRVDQGGMIQLDARSSTSTKNSQNKTMHRSGRSAALNLRNHFGGHSVMVAVRQLTVSLSCLQALESQMKILTVSRSTLASTLICGTIAFAMFMLVSSGQLNVATLRSIDGPLDAQQLASIQLCNLLTVAAGSMICGAIFAAIVMVGSCGRNQRF